MFLIESAGSQKRQDVRPLLNELDYDVPEYIVIGYAISQKRRGQGSLSNGNVEMENGWGSKAISQNRELSGNFGSFDSGLSTHLLPPKSETIETKIRIMVVHGDISTDL